MSHVLINGRKYTRNLPTAAVGICLDGCEYDYLVEAVETGRMPHFARHFTSFLAKACVPTFTNPNNMSIVTGVPPSVTGICGNFWWNGADEIMMNRASDLAVPTVFESLAPFGVESSVITTKGKLLAMLKKGISRGVAMESASDDDTAHSLFTAEELASFTSDVYNPMISIDCIRAGAILLQNQCTDLGIKSLSDLKSPMMMYLSTTDFVQHKHAPSDGVALDFYAALDQVLGKLHSLGATIALTADHGMNAKHDAETKLPHVLFLEDWLVDRNIGARVILPITDPYVVHHGALGGYATVYALDRSADGITALGEALQDLHRGGLDAASGLPWGIDAVYDRATAAAKFDLPPDRIGDFVVMGDRKSVIGRRRDQHDLSAVSELRSHGSVHEQLVPLAFNRPLSSQALASMTKAPSPKVWRAQTAEARQLSELPAQAAVQEGVSTRNYDLFDLLLNHTETTRIAI